MSFLDDLHKVKRRKEFDEKEADHHHKIVRLKREQKFKELEPMVLSLLDQLGMATWGCDDGERNYEIAPDLARFFWRLHSGKYEYVLRLIFDDENSDYFEVGVMGNMARSLDTSPHSLQHILKNIFKRGPDYLGIEGNIPKRHQKKR